MNNLHQSLNNITDIQRWIELLSSHGFEVVHPISWGDESLFLLCWSVIIQIFQFTFIFIDFSLNLRALFFCVGQLLSKAAFSVDLYCHRIYFKPRLILHAILSLRDFRRCAQILRWWEPLAFLFGFDSLHLWLSPWRGGEAWVSQNPQSLAHGALVPGGIYSFTVRSRGRDQTKYSF